MTSAKLLPARCLGRFESETPCHLHRPCCPGNLDRNLSAPRPPKHNALFWISASMNRSASAREHVTLSTQHHGKKKIGEHTRKCEPDTPNWPMRTLFTKRSESLLYTCGISHHLGAHSHMDKHRINFGLLPLHNSTPITAMLIIWDRMKVLRVPLCRKCGLFDRKGRLQQTNS